MKITYLRPGEYFLGMKKNLPPVIIIILIIFISGCCGCHVTNGNSSIVNINASTRPTYYPTATPVTSASGVAQGFQGTWDTTFGPMQLNVSGSRVSGTYSGNVLGSTVHDGRINGTIEGNTLTGTWAQPPTYVGPNDSGRVVMVLSVHGNNFEGKWQCSGSKDWWSLWDGTRV
jgi:hypothetical protein